MIPRLIVFFALIAAVAHPADGNSADRPTNSEVRSESLPIADAFRRPAPDRIRIRIGGAEAFVRGDFFVPKGTTIKNLVLAFNSSQSPLRTTRLFCQVMVGRNSKPIVPWTRVHKLFEGSDTTLEDGDSVLVWSLCFGP